MKIKKLLSVVLALSMIFTIVNFCVPAGAEKTYTSNNSYVLTPEYSLDPDSFSVTATVDQDKISVLDGNSSDYTYEVLSFKGVYADLNGQLHSADYISDEEAFFNVFATREEDIAYAEEFNADRDPSEQIKVTNITLVAEIGITFSDSGLFGELTYNILVKGFSAPMAVGGDLLGSVTDMVKLPVDVSFSKTINEFPSISDVKVISTPIKTEYYDSEKFDPTGLKLEITTSDGDVGTFSYTEQNAHSFSFNPTNKENLSLHDSEVVSYSNGFELVKTPITVNHKWSDGYVNITTDIYTPTKPGYHAIVCEGCGEKHDAQPHVIDENAWVYNNDQTFVANGTESNVCLDCGTIVTRNTQGTADYNTALADFHFIRVILDYINLLLNIIGGAVR